MSQWLFSARRAADRERASTVAEFFATDSIKNRAESLVRESVQNSMDAAVGGASAHVRFHIGTCTDQAVVSSFLDGLGPHLKSSKMGLKGADLKRFRFLTIEDFNTTGLRGDPTDVYEDSDSEADNEYFYFYRAEGKSGKNTGNRGSWGVGKYTLPLASRIRAFVGLTCRQDAGQAGGAGPLVMGQIVLAPHKVGGVSFQPDGWWSNRVAGDLDNPVPVPFGLPGDSTDFDAEAFCSAFDIIRSDQPGLSVMVPYLNDDITAGSLLYAVLKNYGLAIELGTLTVTIDGDGTAVELSRDTLLPTIDSLDLHDSDTLRDEVDLAKWYLDKGRNAPVTLDGDVESMKWEGRMKASEVAAIQAALDAGERCVVRVPIPVAPKHGTAVMSWFDVVLEPQEGSTSTPRFYREGLRISEVKARRTAGVRSIVLVSDGPLARMLGAAETPAHVDWQAHTERFRGRFKGGRDWLSFIKKTPADLLQTVRAGDTEEDLAAAAAFFSLPAPNGRGKKQGDGGKVPPPTPPPTQPSPGLRIERVPGGFRATAGPGVVPGDEFRVRAAYDSRGGNPFKRWSELDFTMVSLEHGVTGATLLEQHRNEVGLSIEEPESFELNVTGFDTHRDVIVVADSVEATE